MTLFDDMTLMTDSERKILQMVKDNPAIITQLSSPSEEFLLSAVFENPSIIRFVHNQSFMLRMLAVKLDYGTLKYVNGTTPEILHAAAAHNTRGIIGANLTHEELEIHANAFNIKKFGFRASSHSR